MTRRIAATALAAVLLCPAAGAAQEPGRAHVEYITTEATKAMGLPFSDAVRVGDMLYLSGAIGVRPGTLELVPGGIEAETRQALENIRAVVERSGSSMEHVVKCTLMLADIAEWPAANRVYVTFFPTNLPARSAFGANGLALGARVEIECLALVPGS